MEILTKEVVVLMYEKLKSLEAKLDTLIMAQTDNAAKFKHYDDRIKSINQAIRIITGKRNLSEVGQDIRI